MHGPRDRRRSKPVTEPQAQLNIGATFTLQGSAGRQAARPRRRPRSDHRQGDVVGGFPRTAAASLLSTAGGLRVRARRARLAARLDAKTGKELWKGNDGATHNGGIISYEAGGKQYIAVVTGGPEPGRRRLCRAIRRPYKYHGEGHGLARSSTRSNRAVRASVPIEPEPRLWRFRSGEPSERLKASLRRNAEIQKVLFRLVE